MPPHQGSCRTPDTCERRNRSSPCERHFAGTSIAPEMRLSRPEAMLIFDSGITISERRPRCGTFASTMAVGRAVPAHITVCTVSHMASSALSPMRSFFVFFIWLRNPATTLKLQTVEGRPARYLQAIAEPPKRFVRNTENALVRTSVGTVGAGRALTGGADGPPLDEAALLPLSLTAKSGL